MPVAMDNPQMTRIPIALTIIAAATILGCNLAQVPTPTAATAPDTANPAPTAKSKATPEPTFPPPTVEVIEIDSETLETLESEEVPSADPIDLARRLNGLTQEIPESLDPPAAPLQVGARQVFHAGNQDTDEQFDVNATLQYATDHAYFWIENGVNYDPISLQLLAETFENRIYPINREFFGSEWNPGIDGDPHIYILYAAGLGDRIAGYFSSVDSLHPLVREDSNAHEMFYFNADTVGFGEVFTYGVLAHEFQHMIHWNLDRDETSWINDGVGRACSTSKWIRYGHKTPSLYGRSRSLP